MFGACAPFGAGNCVTVEAAHHASLAWRSAAIRQLTGLSSRHAVTPPRRPALGSCSSCTAAASLSALRGDRRGAGRGRDAGKHRRSRFAVPSASAEPGVEPSSRPHVSEWDEDTHYDVVVVGGGHAGCEARYFIHVASIILRVTCTNLRQHLFGGTTKCGRSRWPQAALASARLGARTLLLTLNLDRIAWQPCNPAIGGPAKSQLVHEARTASLRRCRCPQLTACAEASWFPQVDALGGEMGKMADRTYLQRRVLNRSKGPAARFPAALCGSMCVMSLPARRL